MSSRWKVQSISKTVREICGSNLHGRSFGSGSQKREPTLRMTELGLFEREQPQLATWPFVRHSRRKSAFRSQRYAVQELNPVVFRPTGTVFVPDLGCFLL